MDRLEAYRERKAEASLARVLSYLSLLDLVELQWLAYLMIGSARDTARDVDTLHAILAGIIISRVESI